MCINEGSMIEIIRYRLPVYWACALINDDYTGLSEEEIQEIDAFFEKSRRLSGRCRFGNTRALPL